MQATGGGAQREQEGQEGEGDENGDEEDQEGSDADAGAGRRGGAPRLTGRGQAGQKRPGTTIQWGEVGGFV